jgi:hypothetical protein
MGTTVEVRFLDANDVLRGGELLTPHTLNFDTDMIEVEFVGDHEVDIMFARSTGQWNIYRTHISRVGNMFPVGVA